MFRVPEDEGEAEAPEDCGVSARGKCTYFQEVRRPLKVSGYIENANTNTHTQSQPLNW